MQDGVMLALTLDGEKITTYPEGTRYGVEITCENGIGKWLVDEWKLAVEKVTGNVVCNINFTSNPITLKNKIEEINVNNNYNSHGYRYSGKKPNNYIWYNNEMWRIIGSIPTCLSASCGTNTTNLVKIIRNNSIGSIAYDAKSSNYTGAWGNNTLYTLLNNYYYGALNGTDTNYCYGSGSTSKSECDYSTIGINPSGYYGKMVKNVYWNTGLSSYDVTPSSAYTNEIKTRTIQGYIGLMSVSDYGYATNSSYHTQSLSENNNSKTRASNNWIYSQGFYEWTNIQAEASTTYLLGIQYTGQMTHQHAYVGFAERPVVYLDSSVFIVSGDGTQSNPYQIGM